ncbi:hypothetical protein [Paraglaciecola hydrolytica]|uniref:Uncharacterized protein n=1 Tax=Paraglaciecola hydrolytica TaxID=1799789 RepID=A0A136A1X2_9ALTE|nr:hypothetical protein [Paraglaciecola hydrolytica]KXI29248.1 hypothetical protein AX660_13965 [Paraglaciecola hydrolytica]
MNPMIRKSYNTTLFNLVCFVVCAFICIASHASTQGSASSYRPNVFYSGIVYLGNFDQIKTNYPYALSINQAINAVGLLDQRFNQLIQQSSPQHFNLHFGLADLKKGQSIAMALAFESENVSTEVIGNNRKIIVEAGAQLFFFDFASMTLIANIPLSMAKNHVVAKELNYQEQLPRLFSELYLGLDGGDSLLTMAFNLLGSAKINLSKPLRFQLEQVSSSENVQVFMPQNITAVRFNQFIGQYFSARLAHQYNISVLPFTKGYAIGNQMAGRFSNGSVFNLNLPTPDYVFSLELLDLKKAPYKDDLMYASRLALSMSQQHSGKVFINEVFQYAVPKLVSANMTQIDDWSAFHDVIEVLIDELVEQLGSPNKKWFKSHAKDNQAYGKFTVKQELFSAK